MILGNGGSAAVFDFWVGADMWLRLTRRFHFGDDVDKLPVGERSFSVIGLDYSAKKNVKVSISYVENEDRISIKVFDSPHE